jgi:hypothetical protein
MSHRETVSRQLEPGRGRFCKDADFISFKNTKFDGFRILLSKKNDHCKKVDTGFKPTKGHKSNIVQFLKMCEEVKEEIRSNSNLLKLHEKRKRECGYFDAGSNILTQDFIYAVTKYLHLQTDIEEAQPGWRWEAGEVDKQEEHIELRYGDAHKTSHEDWTPIARLAKPKDQVFKVEWLVNQESAEHKAMLVDARRDLDFYLVEKEEANPWAYARYHCNTGANMYSPVHWSYFPTGSQGQRLASRVIKLSAEQSAQLFGDAGEPGTYIKSGGG